VNAPLSLSVRTTLIQDNADKLDDYYNKCRAVSHRLADDLLSHGGSAHVLRCSGLRTLAASADQRWHNLGTQNHWIHFVVRISETQIVDLTRRQFFPGCDNPFYQSFEEFSTEWDGIGPEAENFGFRTFRS
jgi:hypothetical protein